MIVFTGRPFSIRIEPISEAGTTGPICFVASAAGVSFSGDTLEEAVAELHIEMVQQYEFLIKLDPARLGKIPQQQLAALKRVLRTIP